MLAPPPVVRKRGRLELRLTHDGEYLQLFEVGESTGKWSIKVSMVKEVLASDVDMRWAPFLKHTEGYIARPRR